MSPLSSAGLSAVLAQQTDKVFLHLVTIAHDDLPGTIRLVADTQDLVIGGEAYTALAFSVVLPDDDSDSLPSVRLVVDNVGQSLIEAIRTMGSGADVTISVVLADSPDTVEAGPFLMKARSASYNASQIEIELGLEDDLLNIAYPFYTFSPSAFAAVVP